MQQIQLEKKQIDLKSLVMRTSFEGDCERLITEPCVAYLGSEPIIFYGRLSDDTTPLVWAAKSLEFSTSTRTTGILTQSKVFGFSPRSPVRFNCCRVASMFYTFPRQHEILCRYGRTISHVYQSQAPEVFARQVQKTSAAVNESWLMPGTPFTAGIVNKNNQLKYHFDKGNFEDCFSCMIVLTNNIKGGNLCLPEFGVKFHLQNKSYFLFNGQKWLHGVTKINKLNHNSYRYSIVYYAQEDMAKCLTAKEELERARLMKTQTARKRARSI